MKTKPRASLFFFWDYDTQWGADRSRSQGGPKDWGHLEFVNTERLLELHERYKVPACFAVVGAASLPGERPYHDPAQIRRIKAAGHEIASHAFQHEWLPALTGRALFESLKNSKDALEQCVGAEVVSFVPPFNQPFDYPAAGSISFAERSEIKGPRTDLGQLCEALLECGYRFCRVAYRPLYLRLADYCLRRRVERPVGPKQIRGVTCLRLNTAGGFDESTLSMLERCAETGGIAVVYGHPHSLHAGNSQDEKWLIPFLERASRLNRDGQLHIGLPARLGEAF